MLRARLAAFESGRDADARVETGHVVVDLPEVGAATFDDVKRALTERGRLELKLVDDDNDVFASAKAPEAGHIAVELDFRVSAPTGAAHGPTHYARIACDPTSSRQACRKRLEDWVEIATAGRIPSSDEIAFGFGPPRTDEPGRSLSPEWRTYCVERRSLLPEAAVSGAKLAESGRGDSETATIDIDLTPSAAEAFETVTGASVGHRLAITIDGDVVSAPVVLDKISGGKVRITVGGPEKRARDEAANLARILRTGTLPLPLVLMSENIVDAP